MSKRRKDILSFDFRFRVVTIFNIYSYSSIVRRA